MVYSEWKLFYVFNINCTWSIFLVFISASSVGKQLNYAVLKMSNSRSLNSCYQSLNVDNSTKLSVFKTKRKVPVIMELFQYCLWNRNCGFDTLVTQYGDRELQNDLDHPSNIKVSFPCTSRKIFFSLSVTFKLKVFQWRY